MSLLADLLSKVKHQEPKGAIPPNLAQIVRDSTKKSKVDKKVILLLILIVLIVSIGFGAVYYMNIFLKSSNDISQRKQLLTQNPEKNVPPPPAPETKATAKAEPQAKAGTPPVSTPPVEVARSHVEKVSPTPGIKTTKKLVTKKSERISGKAEKASDIQQPKKPEETGKISKGERDAYLYSAKTFEYKKDYYQALSNYQSALEADPKNYFIMNNIASVLLKCGSFEESIWYSKNALNIKKDYVPSLINLGVAYIQLNNLKEGESYLLKAKSIEPSNKYMVFNLALLYEKLKDYEKAYMFFSKLSEMEDIRGYLGMARVSEKQGKRSEAEKIYKDILWMNNVDPTIKQQVSERLTQLGK